MAHLSFGNAPVARVIPAATRLAVASFLSGERVNGNAFWYTDADGNFFWAGATDVPTPTAAP